MATPHLKEGILSVIDIDNWTLIKTIKMDGPGFFLRSHESSPYVWADVFFGPHKDDLVLELDGKSARVVASQGQHRAITLALKAAEVATIGRVRGVAPILLLDDVSSELDPERNAFLMGYLKASGAQVVLTTTDERLVRDAAGTQARWYRVRGGTAEPYSSP